MEQIFSKILKGYQNFRRNYALGDQSVMRHLAEYGQQPKIMIIACCDSRVDPAVILQCDPGDLFVVRNVANIVPPFEKDEAHHGTSAALEFGINFLQINHLILLGHSQCGGIQALLQGTPTENDFITNWVSVIQNHNEKLREPDEYAKIALHQSFENCLTFPWIKEKLDQKKLLIHRWFFDIKAGEIQTYSEQQKQFKPLDEEL